MLELNDYDIMGKLDHEIQRRTMQGSGWNLQKIKYLKKNFHKIDGLNVR